ncbi:MAG TPA: DUF1697 domain-containing protein [Gaiellaceae bacterium]|nr:DUF1697 domain-containing protein [Gaiellaceae bacterium]
MKRVVLLRGVNVGGHRRITMAELRALLADAGFGEAMTVGQSGNVLVDSRAAPARLESKLRVLLGVEVIVRTPEELAKVVAADPLGHASDNGSRHIVTFLAAKLPPASARAVAAATVEPEQSAVRGREVYSWHPNGLHESPLAKLLASPKLGVVATARNWNTVAKLHALASVR